MNIDDLDSIEIFKLLEACDELDFNELINDLQKHLIKTKEEWIHHNLFYVYEISLRHQSFSLLQDYCDEAIHENPEIFLKSDDIKLIEKSIFMSILERDELGLKEIDVWDLVIRWGIVQNEELNKHISDWNNDDFIKLKNILYDIIPLIRFNQISSSDFYEKVKPYKEAFNEKIYEEILECYLYDKWQPIL